MQIDRAVPALHGILPIPAELSLQVSQQRIFQPRRNPPTSFREVSSLGKQRRLLCRSRLAQHFFQRHTALLAYFQKLLDQAAFIQLGSGIGGVQALSRFK